jgi:hypothetical protein
VLTNPTGECLAGHLTQEAAMKDIFDPDLKSSKWFDGESTRAGCFDPALVGINSGDLAATDEPDTAAVSLGAIAVNELAAVDEPDTAAFELDIPRVTGDIAATDEPDDAAFDLIVVPTHAPVPRRIGVGGGLVWRKTPEPDTPDDAHFTGVVVSPEERRAINIENNFFLLAHAIGDADAMLWLQDDDGEAAITEVITDGPKTTIKWAADIGGHSI